MKKGFILIIFLLILCGCSQNNKYSEFEKFDLNGRDLTYYDYHNNYDIDKYVLADISKDRYGSTPEGFITGFFYQIETGEYILLDEIESCGEVDAHKYEKDNYFYRNELYITRCTGGVILGYSFDKEKINKKELKLDTSEIEKAIDDYIYINQIEKVTKDDIYFSASPHNLYKKLLIKCSKENLVCSLYE